MHMFNVRPGKGHLAAEALITDPSLVNKSNYENKPAQLSPAKDGPVCRRHLPNEWGFGLLAGRADDQVNNSSIQFGGLSTRQPWQVMWHKQRGDLTVFVGSQLELRGTWKQTSLIKIARCRLAHCQLFMLNKGQNAFILTVYMSRLKQKSVIYLPRKVKLTNTGYIHFDLWCQKHLKVQNSHDLSGYNDFCHPWHTVYQSDV